MTANSKQLKSHLAFLLLAFIFFAHNIAVPSLALATTPVPHLDLELTGAEYRILLEQQTYNLPSILHHDRSLFDDIFATGKRNLDWLQVLNQHRSVPISLTAAETQLGYPIDQPKIYNPQIIRETYQQLQADMPVELKAILFSRDPLPSTLPVSEEDYLVWGLKVDRTYQIAARWKTMEPYIDQLKYNSFDDIRGYYFLSNSPGFPDKLNQWEALSQDEQIQAKQWLIQMCTNKFKNRANCIKRIERVIISNKALDFFNDHKSSSQAVINSMMDIPSHGTFNRTRWADQNHFHVPFVDPANESMKHFLTSNIETEWKFLPFSLHIDFVPQNQYGVKVIWEPGITPHVPRLGDNRIYMDANAPITEYDVQWTIRHEFGHVLGFPDCYIEFYDVDLQAIVGYQIDIEDLMCSRRGHLKERHVKELKRIYR